MQSVYSIDYLHLRYALHTYGVDLRKSFTEFTKAADQNKWGNECNSTP